MGIRIDGSTLFLAALVAAGAAGVAFAIGGACDIRRRTVPGREIAYVLAGLALVVLAGAEIAGRRGGGTLLCAPPHGPADPAAGLIGPLLDEAAAITRQAALRGAACP